MRDLDPIRLDAEIHRELARAATRFGTKSHLAYITEAHTAACNAPDDPLAPLTLLAALQGSAYASRRNQKGALADIGAWLESHLDDHLRTSPAHRLGERIAVELGWLRRMAVAEIKRTGSRHAEGGATHPRPFGRQVNRLGAIWRARAAEPPPTPKPGHEGPDEAPTTPEPVSELTVGFHAVLQARDAWKAARTRLKKKKPLKDKRVRLTIREPSHLAGQAIEASFSLTEGLVGIWRTVDARGGQVHDFTVLEWSEEGDVWLATEVGPSS